MFDSILKRNALPKPKYGVGLGIALSLHAAALLWALWMPAKPPSQTHHETEVILYKPFPQTPPADSELTQLPPPPAPPSSHSPELKRNKIKPLLKPLAAPVENPPEKEPSSRLLDSPPFYSPGEEEGGGEGNPNTSTAHGKPGSIGAHGKPGSIGGPTQHSSAVIPFGEGMSPPKLIHHHPIRFSREALEARVEGLAVVRCTISTKGHVENCRFIQKLPYMDEAILSALYKRKYSPARHQGKEIAVDYNIPIRLQLP